MGANVGIPSSEDLFLLHEGSLYHSYRILGAHVSKRKGYEGVRFAVWAPNAKQVSLLGDFNQWQSGKHRMEKFSSLGVWMLFVPEASEGDHYKYEIQSETGQILLKADPYAFTLKCVQAQPLALSIWKVTNGKMRPGWSRRNWLPLIISLCRFMKCI